MAGGGRERGGGSRGGEGSLAREIAHVIGCEAFVIGREAFVIDDEGLQNG